jgi:hypothetical protein
MLIIRNGAEFGVDIEVLGKYVGRCVSEQGVHRERHSSHRTGATPEYIYKTAAAEVKRKLVEIVSLNHVFRDATVSFDYRKPFDELAKCDPKEKMVEISGFEPLASCMPCKRSTN